MGGYEDIQKDLGVKVEDDARLASKIPEDDVTGFCLWLKNELSEKVSKVSISKRLVDTPALLSSRVSSSMRMMMQMVEAQGGAPDPSMKGMGKDNTMELNAAHPIIVNLNQLRKTDKVRAKLVAESLLDNVMIESNMPFDMQAGIDRRYKMIN